MTSLFLLVLPAAQPVPASLEQVRAEVNAEHRARLAIDYATLAEKNAEMAYAKGDIDATAAGTEKCRREHPDSAGMLFLPANKIPRRNPGAYKYAEMRSREAADPAERSETQNGSG